ncbi:unnamed protein product [Protopolystoma xenopodis]|uniref:Uncharacterized protein n=1 Tax=Protopolystoma xenopodis TaxID=117903 RepID=A0A3S5AE30_9PLAT|nr:unnamed protein product [Protopolystoma xenopodis]
MDERVSRIPYHALSPTERETYNGRRTVMVHLAKRIRDAVVARQVVRSGRES